MRPKRNPEKLILTDAKPLFDLFAVVRRNRLTMAALSGPKCFVTFHEKLFPIMKKVKKCANVTGMYRVTCFDEIGVGVKKNAFVFCIPCIPLSLGYRAQAPSHGSGRYSPRHVSLSTSSHYGKLPRRMVVPPPATATARRSTSGPFQALFVARSGAFGGCSQGL